MAQNDSFSRRSFLSRTIVPAAAVVGMGFGPLDQPAHAATARETTNNLGGRVYNIRDYGAKGDGTTLDTVALQATIDACHRDGGGTVLVPAGEFQIGTVELRSDITLHIAAAGKLLGTSDGKKYHAVDAIPLSVAASLDDGNWALIFAVNAKNVTIEGPGTIDGQGAQFRSPGPGLPPPSGLDGDKRPYHLLFYRCQDLTVRNISLLESAYHSTRVIQSKRVHMDNIYIYNRVTVNNDGFHFISAEYVTISNCTVQSLDDACALFGSCKYVTITNCSFSTRWSVFRFGAGVAENIAVSNCLLYQVYGCPIKFEGNPGTRYENMSFSNLVLQDVTGPILISIGPRTDATGTIEGSSTDNVTPAIVRNISFSNIHGTVTTNPPIPPFPGLHSTDKYNPGEAYSCISLNSVGSSILENISFDNVHLTFGGGGTAEQGARRNLPEIVGEYFALGTMPAYGLYARNVRGLTLQNVRLNVQTPDLRPAVILDHVEDVAINGFSAEGNAEAESLLRFSDTRNALLSACRVLGSASVFLQVEGTGSEDILIDGGDLHKAASPLSFQRGATEKSVRIRT